MYDKKMFDNLKVQFFVVTSHFKSRKIGKLPGGCGKERDIRIGTYRICDCQFICFKQKQKQKRLDL